MGILYTDSHTDTICAGAQFRNLSGTIMVCEAGLFGEVMGKFKDIELCTTFTAYYKPMNVETYILLCRQPSFLDNPWRHPLYHPLRLEYMGALLMILKHFTKGSPVCGEYTPEVDPTIPCSMTGEM